MIFFCLQAKLQLFQEYRTLFENLFGSRLKKACFFHLLVLKKNYVLQLVQLVLQRTVYFKKNSVLQLVKILKPMVTVNIKVYQPPTTSTSFKKLWCGKSQRWSHRGRRWPRGHILKSLALASKPQVLGLEASSPRKLPCPQLEDSTIF